MQLACFASAFWVALTRVKDHMHHPGDVIAGALIGTLIQVSTGCSTFFKNNFFRPFKTVLILAHID